MIKHEGDKWVLYSKDGSKKLFEDEDKGKVEEREKEIDRIKHAKEDKADVLPESSVIETGGYMEEIELTITKAAFVPDGQGGIEKLQWQAVASDTDPDKTNEQTSLALFQDWIERTKTGRAPGYLPTPRMPFLGLSHYPDLDGLAEAGFTTQMWVDKDTFKASGQFYSDGDHPLGKALFDAVRKEHRLITKRGRTLENPIRISAAWWDIAHKHGNFVFERKSRMEQCPMCAKGAKDKVYLKGQLDHFAATRVPINPRTSLELTERAMTTRREDALSIVDDPDLVEEIDKKAKLLGKSETEQELPEGMVVRADEDSPEPEDASEPEAIVEQMMDEPMEGHPVEEYRPFGGAMTLDDAQAWIDAQERMEQVYSNWSMFQGTVVNILELSEPDEIKDNIQEILTQFSDRVAAIKAAIEDVALLDGSAVTESILMKGDAIMDTPTTNPPVAQPVQAQHPAEVFRSEMDKILIDPTLDREAKAKALQEQLNALGSAVKSSLDIRNPQDVGEAVIKAFTPLAEKLDLLIAKMSQGYVQEVPAQYRPQQKSFAPVGPINPNPAQPEQLPISPETGKPSSITAMVRRSVGIQ